MSLRDANPIYEAENAYWHNVPYRRHQLFLRRVEVFRQSIDVPGDIVECGVYKGVSLIQWAHLRRYFGVEEKTIWGYDCFERPPRSTGYEQELMDSLIEDCGEPYTEARVREILGGLQIKDVRLVKQPWQVHDVREGGGVEWDPYIAELPNTVSFVHLDFDLYYPTMSALAVFRDKMPKGAIIALDNAASFPRELEAVQDYFGGDVEIRGHRPAWVRV